MFHEKDKKAFRYLVDQPWVPIVISIAYVILAAVHVRHEILSNSTKSHVLADVLLVTITAVSAAYLWRQLVTTFNAEQRVRRKLQQAERRAEKWEEQQHSLIQQFSSAIDNQFEQWDLTPTEKEVAFLLLKGLSMRAISSLRDSTPHSVRTQAHTIYRKADLGGRAELSAFFLGGLLPPRAGLPEDKSNP